MIPGRYAKNMSALAAILKSAHDSEVEVLVYIAPVNTDQGQRPYVESEYTQFKSEVQVLSERYAAVYVNLEDLIPEPLWGSKDSTSVKSAAETDFMHFTAAGHMTLTSHLEGLFKGGLFAGGKRPE
jgi:lysophospholipase L1-like esterase